MQGNERSSNRSGRDQMRSRAHYRARYGRAVQRFVQNHNIRHDFDPKKFGNWRAFIIGCTSSGPLKEPHKCLERNAPLRRGNDNKQAALGVQSND